MPALVVAIFLIVPSTLLYILQPYLKTWSEQLADIIAFVVVLGIVGWLLVGVLEFDRLN